MDVRYVNWQNTVPKRPLTANAIHARLLLAASRKRSRSMMAARIKNTTPEIMHRTDVTHAGERCCVSKRNSAHVPEKAQLTPPIRAKSTPRAKCGRDFCM